MFYRVLSKLLILSTTCNLRLTPHNYYSMAETIKHQTTGIVLSQSYGTVIYAPISKRTMSTSSKPVPVKVYLNPDKEKELIVNENKGRTGIYR